MAGLAGLKNGVVGNFLFFSGSAKSYKPGHPNAKKAGENGISFPPVGFLHLSASPRLMIKTGSRLRASQ
jgi:hypothetical protein